jgi:hypothetical protein
MSKIRIFRRNKKKSLILSRKKTRKGRMRAKKQLKINFKAYYLSNTKIWISNKKIMIYVIKK